jgi:hypothetical protein
VGCPKGDLNPAVHEARKDLKKLRAVLRLVRDDLGDAVYRSENVRFRDAGRMLSGARDAHVRVETLAALRERFDDASRLTAWRCSSTRSRGNANASRTPTATRWRSIVQPERSRPAGRRSPSGRFTTTSGP